MADIAARREARRRRILENSENRLQKITGKSTENPTNDKSNDGANSKSKIENGFVIAKSISTEEDKTSLANQTKDFEHQDKNLELNEQSRGIEETLTHHNTYNEYNLKNVESTTKENQRNCDNLKFNSSSTSFSEQSNVKQLPQDSYLYNIFFTPISLVLLAVCLNILFLMNINFSTCSNIVTPFILLITTQLCLRKPEDIQGSSMLAATLVLCNVKPEIVNILKKMFILSDTIAKNFALYITSFLFINWITTTIFYNSRQIQFF